MQIMILWSTNHNILCAVVASLQGIDHLRTILGMSAANTIYLDHNATSPCSAAVIHAVNQALSEMWGNPSSPHLAGRRARAALSNARDSVAALAGCDADRLLFTSGATESCNHVIRCARRPSCERPALVTTVIEHAAVAAAAERETRDGRSHSMVGVDSNGIIDLHSLEDVVAEGNALVSVQWVNNELGVIQPIQSITTICQHHGALLHVDASQALGKLSMDLDELGADFVSMSGHKIGAPSGVGALYVKDRRTISALQVGGEQERARRAGTENLLGILGFGAAAAERFAELPDLLMRWSKLRDEFESRLPFNARVNGRGAPRVPNTISATFPAIDGAILLARLDSRGIYVSQGSACHSARPEPSHVLRAIGLSEADAYGTIRFSFGPTTTADELRETCAILASETQMMTHREGSAVA